MVVDNGTFFLRIHIHTALALLSSTAGRLSPSVLFLPLFSPTFRRRFSTRLGPDLCLLSAAKAPGRSCAVLIKTTNPLAERALASFFFSPSMLLPCILAIFLSFSNVFGSSPSSELTPNPLT